MKCLNNCATPCDRDSRLGRWCVPHAVEVLQINIPGPYEEQWYSFMERVKRHFEENPEEALEI